MSTRIATVVPSGTAVHADPSSCDPCATSWRPLDCPEQPRFFCGQLLTDQDLTKLLEWARDKLRLTRFRQGWGVISGLAVRCDPRHHGTVIVGPGYAVDRGGDDIIVCQDATLDLSPACREEPHPCTDLRRRNRTESESKPPDQGIIAVDLSICYDEQKADPQTALARYVCGDTAACEYSRTRETFRLCWQDVAPSSDPLNTVVERWLSEYNNCLDVLHFFQGRFNSNSLDGQGATIRSWLVDWIEQHPPHQLCFLRDWICSRKSGLFETEAELVKLLFLLVLDCRIAFLSRPCADPGYGGVPLARVVLQAHQENGRRSCRIVSIDAYPPFRRPIGPACWPARLGQVNLGQIVWHRTDDAFCTLHRLGFRQFDVKEQFPTNLTDLSKAQALTGGPFADCGRPLILLTVDVDAFLDVVLKDLGLDGALNLGTRVVGLVVDQGSG